MTDISHSPPELGFWFSDDGRKVSEAVEYAASVMEMHREGLFEGGNEMSIAETEHNLIEKMNALPKPTMTPRACQELCNAALYAITMAYQNIKQT